MGRQNNNNKPQNKQTIILICDDTAGGLDYLRNTIKDKYPHQQYAITLGKTLSPKIQKPDLHSDKIYKLIKDMWEDNYKKIHDFLFIIADGDLLKGNINNNIKNFSSLSNNDPKVKFILNTPCIEIWYLCHFMQPPNEPDRIITILDPYMSDYQKSTNPYETLQSKQTIACQNAAQIRAGKDIHTASIWTDMDNL